MENVVYTYGAGELLAQVFNAITALVNADFGILHNNIVRFALSIGLMMTIATMIYGENLTGFLKTWVVPSSLALSMLFVPETKVHINDRVTGYRYTVDHVPWGLGVSAGILSSFGHAFTKGVEMVFSLPDDLKYHKTGSMMASNLIANSRMFRVTNSELRETMKSFVNQCVVYDAMLGRKYTFTDLKNSKDIWRLVSENASPARSFVFKAPGRDSAPEVMTCRQGVERLTPLLTQDVENAFQLFDRKIFGMPGQNETPRVPGAMLKQYLPGAMNYMTDMAKTANDYMMQQLMIHTVVDGIESKSTELGNAQNFAVRKAYLQQRANQETVAGIAAQKVVALKNIMEILVYVAFMFMIPMALIPNGSKALTLWFGLLVWVQLWPPFYAVLNFIQTFAGRKKSLGLLTDEGGAGMTISNSVGMIDLHADMAAQAGFMSLTVGTLAYALVKGGAGSFVHLAGQMTGPAASAAASASESMMSGNYSYGNVTSGTIAANNSTAGQFNDSPTYASGSFTQNDGITSRVTGGDEHVVSVANSNLRSKVNLADSLESRYSEQSGEAARMAESQGVNAATAEADQYRKTIDFAGHQSMSQSGGTGSTFSENASQNQQLTKLNNLTEKFAEDHGISKSKAADLIAKVSTSASMGFGFNVFGNGAESRVSVDGAAQATGNYTDRDAWNSAQDFVKQNGIQDLLSQGSQAVRDMRVNDMSDEGQRLAQGVSGAYDKSQNYREEAGKNLQRSQDFSRMASDTRANSVSINEDASQRYVSWLKDQSLPNSKGPMGIKEAETILSSRPELNRDYQRGFVDQEAKSMQSYIQSGSGPKSMADVGNRYDTASIKNPVNQNAQDVVRQKAEKEGFGDGFHVDTYAQTKVNNTMGDVSSKIDRGQTQVQSEGNALLGSVGNAGLEGKVMDLEDQMASQTEAMEKAAKMQKLMKSK